MKTKPLALLSVLLLAAGATGYFLIKPSSHNDTPGHQEPGLYDNPNPVAQRDSLSDGNTISEKPAPQNIATSQNAISEAFTFQNTGSNDDASSSAALPQAASKMQTVPPVHPATLLIDSSDPAEGAIEVVIDDNRLVPFVLQGAANPAGGTPEQQFAAPVQTALDNIANDFADAILSASQPGAPVNSPQAQDSTESVLPDSALRQARDIADQRYRALFGNAAFNSAGIQRALSRQGAGPEGSPETP